VNTLLSVTYTMLTEAVYSATVLAGLDPYCGFYHAERWGRPALVLDLMEEFRPLVADSVVLTLVNKRMLSPKDFRPGPTERPVILDLEGYQTVLRAFGERLRTGVTIPRLKRRTTYQRLLEFQARGLAAAIEGQRPGYEPFRSR
jgi:CRISPR-associated protein Cas1